jgi:hypothetical protein
VGRACVSACSSNRDEDISESETLVLGKEPPPLPIAVEVELTSKSKQVLTAIFCAWAGPDRWRRTMIPFLAWMLLLVWSRSASCCGDCGRAG